MHPIAKNGMHSIAPKSASANAENAKVRNHQMIGRPIMGSCHKRQKAQAPTPQAQIRKHRTRKVANAKGHNRNTNLT